MVAKLKQDWHEKLGEAWELQIPSLRITIEAGLTEDENHKHCLAELEALDKKKKTSSTTKV